MFHYQCRCYEVVYVFVLSLYFTLLNAKVFESTSVDVGKTAVLTCYDQVWPSTYEGYFIDLYFKSNEVGSNFVTIARYKPSTNETRPFVSSWENRINFLASGFVQLQHITLNDEGTYHCESNSYEIHPDTDVKWYTSVIVHVPPTIKVTKITDPMQAGNGLVEAAKCEAIGGKPAATVAWKSPRNFEISERKSTVNTTNGLADASSILQFSPTRFYNNERFVCEVTHDAFDQPAEETVIVNVTFPPASVQIKPDVVASSITCSAEGNPPVNYVWILPGNQRFDGPTVQLVSPEDPSRQNDSYICIVSNSRGSVRTNTTTYSALHVVHITNSPDAGMIAGIVIAVLVIVAVIGVGLFFYCRKVRQTDKGPYSSHRATLLTQSTSNPPIQHANDHLNRPPSPHQPPPDHDNEQSSSDESDEGNHDVDLETKVPQYDTPPAEGITSQSSMKFRAHRQRPNSSPSSRRSRGPPVQEQIDDPHPGYMTRYDVPPGNDAHDGYEYEHEGHPNSGQRYNNDSYPYHQPGYVDYPAGDSRGDTSQYEPKYSEIDHSGYRQGSDPRRMQYDPVEYAQIRQHGTHIV